MKPTEGVGDRVGVISLVFWSITLIVSSEIVGFIMRDDERRGEGGILGADRAAADGLPAQGRGVQGRC